MCVCGHMNHERPDTCDKGAHRGETYCVAGGLPHGNAPATCCLGSSQRLAWPFPHKSMSANNMLSSRPKIFQAAQHVIYVIPSAGAHAHAHAHTHAHARARTHTRAHTRTHARGHAHTHAPAREHGRTHARTRTHTHTHKHTHTHAHAPTPAPAPAPARAPGTTPLDNLQRQHLSSQTSPEGSNPGKPMLWAPRPAPPPGRAKANRLKERAHQFTERRRI